MPAAEEVGGRRLEGDAAIIEEQHTVCHLAGKAHLVRHHQHGHAGIGQLAHHVQHFLHHFRVQRRSGLIKEHHARLHGQRPGNGHALLLTARERMRVLVGMVFQAHAGQQRHGPFTGLLARELAHAARRQREVVQHRQVREQVELLEHHAHFLAQGFQPLAVVIDLDAVDDDATGIVPLQPVQHPQEGALARAGGAHDHGHLAGVETRRHVGQHLMLTKALADVAHLDQGAAGTLVLVHVCLAHFWRPSTSIRCSTAVEICVSTVVSSR